MVETFKGTVIEKKQLTEDVILLSLEVPEGFEFKAGQFVSLVMFNEAGEKKLKSYSILNSPSQRGRLDLCIKIIDGGFASDIFCACEVGKEFEIKGPMGHFVFEDDGNGEYWFLGAGTGVAPLHSMISEFVGKMPEKKFVLLFGVREKKCLFLHEEFLKLAEEHDNFEYKPVLSREEWGGCQGHVQDNLPEDLKNKTFYICGLKELVLETKELLVERGVSPSDIKSERYS